MFFYEKAAMVFVYNDLGLTIWNERRGGLLERRNSCEARNAIIIDIPATTQSVRTRKVKEKIC